MDDRGGARALDARDVITRMTTGLRATLLGGIGAVVIAGASQAQTFRFTEFEIQGNTRIEAATILTNLGVAPGQTVSAGQLNDGFQRLQGSGLFQRVEIIPQGGKLLILVDEFPTINRISIEGNARLSDEDLLTVVTSTPRRTYSPAQAERDAAAITDAYAASGRLATTVVPKIIERSGNRVDLVFEVAEGRVSEVERLSFVGNRAFSDRRLRRVLETSQAGIFRAIIGSDTFVADRIAFDQQLLRDFYLSRGYADFRVLSATPELAPSRDAFFVTFQVEEGQQFRFGEVSADSVLDVIDVPLYDSEIRVRPGDVFSPQAVERTIERLELLALREGLDFIRVTPRFSRNDRDLTIDVVFEVERGERIFVERIDIEGNATTLDRVIRRQFDTVEGDPFNPRAIRAAAERIRALDYFSQADVNARAGTAEGQVIVDVDVEEQPTGSLGFGINYSVEDGAGVALSFAETNFLGRGQTLNFTIDTGSQDTSSNITFVEPFFLNRDLAASFSLFYRETDDDDQSFDTRSIGVRPGLEFPTGEFSRLGVFYSLTEDTLNPNDTTQLSQILENDEGSNITSSFGYRFTYNTIGRGLDPTRGVRLRFGQEFAGLGGDAEFVKTTVEATGQRTIANEEITLRASFEGGILTSLGDTNSLQANRFFNGPRIIRGFESGGIGPRDLNADDDALGGNQYVAARFEALFPIGILPDEYGISGAAFVDMASVWGLDDTNGGPDGGQPVDDEFFLNSAVGFGILWDTQIGPLRFNFTSAINKRDFDREQNFDLTIQTRF
ncbi:outer membrane protein assembly factor BamA [Jannaschia seohaensis]|uniref:Outer membrane protein assembly factor BamA n=1 Tax=Jannaschia seohaensis TaxID=475081 RepID=A0A2Y9APG1_9RHOB|nr:outer membrane protein assembly factor BamA [Jannaschia seohaensis]PWJ19314.1 outer membrane protein insertion porin family [Jannaschia seohaensis]SSA45976.1 outer membrane protein insertion porin family [Jannaschia seohaensis]